MNNQRSGRRQWVEFAVLGVIVIVLLAGWILLREPSNGRASTAMSSTPPSGTKNSEQPTLLNSATGASAQATPLSSATLPPAALAAGGLTITADANTPAFSRQEAMQIVSDLGVSFGLGGEYEGQAVSIASTYGLGTLGHPGGPGQPWMGDRYFPLKGTNTVLDHIENRPMWILDYGHIKAYGSQATFNHAVYTVDIQTRSVLTIWFYNGE
jgi:hypothetical protein